MFDLPEAFVTSILHQWVDIRALQHLDSACCRTLLREQLLQMFSGETFIYGCGRGQFYKSRRVSRLADETKAEVFVGGALYLRRHG
jgi:hypothetical protein